MPKLPSNDERPDNDRTDELPVLLETVVLHPSDPSLAGHDSLSDDDSLDETGERTARYAAFATESDDEAELAALKSDLATRAAQISALEQDIGKLSARWNDVERHLTDKDARIEELSQTAASLRQSLAERQAAEQRLLLEVGDRNLEQSRLLDELEQQRRQLAAQTSELEQQHHQLAAQKSELEAAQAAARTAEQEAAALRTQARAGPPETGGQLALQQRHEQLATLITYIGNRRIWWDELKASAAASTQRIEELEREVEALNSQRRSAEALAARETSRAKALRAELIEQARLVETLRRERPGLRALSAATDPAVTTLRKELVAARAATAHAVAELMAAREAPDGREHSGAEGPAAQEPPVAFEVMAQLEAEVEYKRQQVAAQLVELREREQRLGIADKDIERLQYELATGRSELDQARADRARLERALLDKDRGIESRDARITTLQTELNERLGALQKLNAMDISLQGLDTKMSERLRGDPSAIEHGNTAALICLTGDAPKQFALTKAAITIGRGTHCDIQILTQFVSREHARVTVIRNKAFIEDAGSTNGVFINSLRVDGRQELQHGDLLTVGETQFRYIESMAH